MAWFPFLGWLDALRLRNFSSRGEIFRPKKILAVSLKTYDDRCLFFGVDAMNDR